MGKMNKPLSDAEVNHLRKLLGWVRGEIGQSPEEMADTFKAIAPAIGSDVSPEALARVRASYDKSAAVPKYVRAAVKALEKTIIQHAGEVVDAGPLRDVPEIASGPDQ